MDYRLLYAALLILFTSTPATAQQPTPSDRTDAVRVFLDCLSCDENYIRTEITFVNFSPGEFSERQPQSLTASYIPARRALAVDPLRALRME